METKSILFSKVFWLAVIQGIIGVMVAIGTQIPNVGWVLVTKSALDILLRILTTVPVSIP